MHLQRRLPLDYESAFAVRFFFNTIRDDAFVNAMNALRRREDVHAESCACVYLEPGEGARFIAFGEEVKASDERVRAHALVAIQAQSILQPDQANALNACIAQWPVPEPFVYPNIDGLPNPRNAQPPQDWVALLLQHPPQVRARWLKAALRTNPHAAFAIAKRVHLPRALARELVEDTIEHSDASTVRWWLDFYAEKHGLRAALVMLQRWHETHPREARLALYWVGSLPGAGTPEGRAQLDAFVAWSRARKHAP